MQAYDIIFLRLYGFFGGWQMLKKCRMLYSGPLSPLAAVTVFLLAPRLGNLTDPWLHLQILKPTGFSGLGSRCQGLEDTWSWEILESTGSRSPQRPGQTFLHSESTLHCAWTAYPALWLSPHCSPLGIYSNKDLKSLFLTWPRYLRTWPLMRLWKYLLELMNICRMSKWVIE